MRHFSKLGIFCFILIVTCTLCSAAGRRRLSSRSPPYFQSYLRSSSPPVSHRIPTTSQPYRLRPTSAVISNPFYNFGAAALNSELAAVQREGNHKIRCRNAHEIFGDPNNRFLYKVCIPIGHTWIFYSYRCPNGTEFDETSRKCIVSVSTLSPSSTQTSATHVTELTTSKTTSKIPLSSTTEIGTIPDNSVESLESSSSSSEESSTSPSETPISTTSATPSTSTTTKTTTQVPTTTTVSSFVQNLINHGIMQKPPKDRFALISKLLMSTTRPEWENMSIYKGQYKLPPTTTRAAPSLGVRPLNQEKESDNSIWESLYNSENQKPTPTSTVRSLVTRWKVVQDNLATVTPQPGRFPGLRPSPMIT